MYAKICKTILHKKLHNNAERDLAFKSLKWLVLKAWQGVNNKTLSNILFPENWKQNFEAKLRGIEETSSDNIWTKCYLVVLRAVY